MWRWKLHGGQLSAGLQEGKTRKRKEKKIISMWHFTASEIHFFLHAFVYHSSVLCVAVCI